MAHIGAKVQHMPTGQLGTVIQAKMSMYLVQFGPVTLHSFGMYHETEIEWAGETLSDATLVEYVTLSRADG